ncbi:MAG TPA: hypothetical protein VFE60_16895 [Roseiarcus sp.]|nr:hypothetical protein [Roseiarcus sp.]
MSARSRKTVCLQNGAPPGGRRWLSLVAGVSGALAAQAASADPQVILPNGLPVQVKPTYSEPGLPAFSFPTGGGSLLGGSPGSVDTGAGGGDGSASAGTGSSGGSGDAYNAMMSQSWGSAAANAAGAMGVSATALAATCVMESNCQNVGASAGGSASGAFQMINSTYTADINGAVAYDPAISGSIVSGLAGQMDPTTEAYAAAYELRTDAINLQNNAGISDPTVLDARAVYQFGAGAGPRVAEANDSDNLESIINLSPASLAANGLTANTTVGQWRQTVVTKLGSATANQSILSN